MIARKLLEIPRTDIFINLLTQIKKRKEKNVSVNRSCLGEFGVITCSDGQGADDRHRRWIFN